MKRYIIVSIILVFLFSNFSCKKEAILLSVKDDVSGGFYTVSDSAGIKAPTFKSDEVTFIDTTNSVSFDYLEHVVELESEFKGLYEYAFLFDSVGAVKIYDLTRKSERIKLALIIRDTVFIKPNVSSKISNGRLTLSFRDSELNSKLKKVFTE